MKPTKAWAIVTPSGRLVNYGFEMPLQIFATKKEAEIESEPIHGEKIVRVEIREVDRKSRKVTQ